MGKPSAEVLLAKSQMQCIWCCAVIQHKSGCQSCADHASVQGRNPVSWIGCWVLKNQHQDLRPVPGQEDVCDTHWAALCPGMRLSDERCQHLRVMLTAWYLVEVRLGEAGVFAERWQTVKANELHVMASSISQNSVSG